MGCLPSSSSVSPHGDQVNLEVHSEAVIEQVWRYTWRLWLSEFGDAHGGRDWASLKMHLEAVIMRTWRPYSCKCRDTHECSDGASLVMHVEAVRMRISRCTWRPSSCEVGGHNRASLGIHLQAVIELVWRYNWRPWSSEIGGVLRGSRSGNGNSRGRRDGRWDSIHWLTPKCGNVENWVQHGLPRDQRLGASAKKYYVRAKWLRQSGRAPSEPSETPWWRITPHPASIHRVTLYIALRLLFHCLFAFCQSLILNDHSRLVANCDHTSEWVHRVRVSIMIGMRWVTLQISLLAFLLPARKMQFSLY